MMAATTPPESGGVPVTIHAATVNALAQLRQLLVGSGALRGFLRQQPGGDVVNVFFRHGLRHAFHHGVFARAAAKFHHLLDEIVRVLVRQPGLRGNVSHASAAFAVAGQADA